MTTPNWIVSLAENGSLCGMAKERTCEDHFILLSNLAMNIGIFVLLLSVAVAYEKARSRSMYDLS